MQMGPGKGPRGKWNLSMSLEHTVRSLLFTPGTRPDRFAKAAASGADIVAIDLEDSVAPAEKDAAREQTLPWFSAPRAGQELRALRINSLRTEHGLKDVLAIRRTEARPDLVLLPKAGSPAELEQLDELLGGPLQAIRFVAGIESARGLSRVDSIAQSTPRLAALFLGAGDLSADLRCANTREGLLYARAHIVRAAAQARIDVLDSPCFDLSDPATLAAELESAIGLGFTGKAAIHPKQIAPIHAAFTPSARQIEEANRILMESDKGVGVVGGQMIDEADARRARRILALARRT
jgi:(S)-citramalyl-CoA lyase